MLSTAPQNEALMKLGPFLVGSSRTNWCSIAVVAPCFGVAVSVPPKQMKSPIVLGNRAGAAAVGPAYCKHVPRQAPGAVADSLPIVRTVFTVSADSTVPANLLTSKIRIGDRIGQGNCEIRERNSPHDCPDN